MSRFTAGEIPGVLDRRRVVCALLCALLMTTGVGTASAQGSGKPRISDTRVERAPIGKKGGLMNPVASCNDYSEPRVRTVVKGLDTDFRAHWKYRGSYPGYYFPRVAVGRYELSTVAWCGRKKAQRVEVVSVKEKTVRTTMSWSEFQRIEKGMTPTQVRKIVGYRGTGNRYGNQMWRTYDLMAFWQYGTVEFRKGRLIRKSWKLGHD